jgi:hypothetical protein
LNKARGYKLHPIHSCTRRRNFAFFGSMEIGLGVSAFCSPGWSAAGCGSKVPTLGYGVSDTIGNVLLAFWGTVIVALLA